VKVTRKEINAAKEAFAKGIGVRITDPNEFAIMGCEGSSFVKAFWDEGAEEKDNKLWVAFLTHEDRPQIIFVDNDLLVELCAELIRQNKTGENNPAFIYDEEE
jgi:hypothetical protein